MKNNTKVIIMISSLLVIILLSGLLSLYFLYNSANKLEGEIQKVCVFVQHEQWDDANNQLVQFEEKWNKTKLGWAILLDHFEIDNIATSLIKSKKYVETHNYSLSIAELEALRQFISHIPEKEDFSIENIL